VDQGGSKARFVFGARGAGGGYGGQETKTHVEFFFFCFLISSLTFAGRSPKKDFAVYTEWVCPPPEVGAVLIKCFLIQCLNKEISERSSIKPWDYDRTEKN
jgi:hypothetical protein